MMPKHSVLARRARHVTAFLAVSLLTVAACSDSGGGSTGGSTVTSVEIVTIPNSQTLVNLVPLATIQMLGVPTNAADNWVDKPVTWVSSAPAVASVSATGLVEALAGGTAYIRATAGGKTDSIAVSVRYPVGTVTLAPAVVTLNREGAQQLTATTLDTQGATVTGRTITWTTSDATIATVSATGLVSASAVNEGSATITATAANAADGGVAAIATRTVTVAGNPVVQTVTVTGGSGFRGNVGTVQLTATATSGLGNPIAGAVITWSTNLGGVGTVDGTGLVTFAGGTDSLRITATAAGQGIGGSDVAGVAAFRVATNLADGDSLVIPDIAELGFLDYAINGSLGDFEVRIFAGSGGDVDMYVFNPAVTLPVANDAGGTAGGAQGYTCRPWNVGSNETCAITATAGWWRARMYAYGQGSGVASGVTVRLLQP